MNRLSEEKLDNIYNDTCKFFDYFFEKVECLDGFASDDYEMHVMKNRHEKGGSVFYRPIGWSIFMRVLGKISHKYGWEKSIDLISKLPSDFKEAPFKDIVWHPSRRSIITKGKILSSNLLLYMLDEYKDQGALLIQYRKFWGEGFENAALPSKIVAK